MTTHKPVGYQRAAYAELLECARDFFDGNWRGLPINIRINPLLVASTGVGKTFLVNRLAADLGLPIFTATPGEWILLCANLRGAPPTLPLLYEFVQNNSRGIVFLDEIEKLGRDNATASDWSRCYQLEIFSVFDRRVIPGVLEEESGPKFTITPADLTERFQRSIFLIAAGSWQSLWETKPSPIGFVTGEEDNAAPTHAELAASLRLEILNRCGKPLILPPLTAGDYSSVLNELCDRLPADLQAILRNPPQQLLDDAVRTKKGFRFFEELLATAVRALRLSKAPSRLPLHEPGSDSPLPASP